MIAELNIGGLACNGLVFENPRELKTPYKIIPTRFYDGLLNHMSNGGLTLEVNDVSQKELDYAQEMMIKKLGSLGIHYDQIMTNFYFTCDHFDERLCKRLDLLSEVDGQGVTVSTVDVAKYIKKEYPKLLIRWSITAVYRDSPVDIFSYVNRVLEFADRIVLPPEYNKDWETLASLPVDKIELMVLDQCGDKCKFRKMHYTLSSADQRRLANGEMTETSLNRNFCDTIHCRQGVDLISKDGIFVRPSEIKHYMNIGINKFKIASRNFVNTYDAPYYLDLVLPTMAGDFLVEEKRDLSIFEEEFERLFSDMRELSKEL